MKVYSATGRRKTAVARVRLIAPGSGKFVINKKEVMNYFDNEINRREALKPITVTDHTDQFEISLILLLLYMVEENRDKWVPSV